MRTVFESLTNTTVVADDLTAIDGAFAAFQPAWSTDGELIASGWGNAFQAHSEAPMAVLIYSSNATGSGSEAIPSNTTGSTYEIVSDSSILNSGFPSFSADNTAIVYRTFGLGEPLGLRILNLTTGDTFTLTTGWDNTPAWSPDGSLIVFTRRTSLPNANAYEDNYDVCTIKPDGTDYTVSQRIVLLMMPMPFGPTTDRSCIQQANLAFRTRPRSTMTTFSRTPRLC